ncbi:MAG: hypothetical protein EOO41_05695, partial [Methanobacteriota archaeon]
MNPDMSTFVAESDRSLLALWEKEAAFRRQLVEVAVSTIRRTGLDLYEYLDSMTSESEWDRTYISLHELCLLTSKVPCEPGSHFSCGARRVMDAYHKIKAVTLTGGAVGTRRHVPSFSYINSGNFRVYRVLKTNRSGMQQSRALLIDSTMGCLVNVNTASTVRRKLPLLQLLQMERYVDDPVRLTLVFSSNGIFIQSLQGGDVDADELE